MQIGPSDRHTAGPQKPRSSPAGAFLRREPGFLVPVPLCCRRSPGGRKGGRTGRDPRRSARPSRRKARGSPCRPHAQALPAQRPSHQSRGAISRWLVGAGPSQWKELRLVWW